MYRFCSFGKLGTQLNKIQLVLKHITIIPLLFWERAGSVTGILSLSGICIILLQHFFVGRDLVYFSECQVHVTWSLKPHLIYIYEKVRQRVTLITCTKEIKKSLVYPVQVRVSVIHPLRQAWKWCPQVN